MATKKTEDNVVHVDFHNKENMSRERAKEIVAKEDVLANLLKLEASLSALVTAVTN